MTYKNLYHLCYDSFESPCKKYVVIIFQKIYIECLSWYLKANLWHQKAEKSRAYIKWRYLENFVDANFFE